jgi:hypothetical protein
MANALYPKTKAKLMRALIDLEAVTIKAVLVDLAGYTYLAAHEFLQPDVPGAARIATSAALTGGAVNAELARFDSDDVPFLAVNGPQIKAIILYIDTGAATTSPLLMYQDTGIVGVPFTPSGNDVQIVVDANGWFGL